MAAMCAASFREGRVGIEIEANNAGSGSIINTPGIWSTACRIDVVATAIMTAGTLVAYLVRFIPIVIATVNAASPRKMNDVGFVVHVLYNEEGKKEAPREGSEIRSPALSAATAANSTVDPAEKRCCKLC